MYRNDDTELTVMDWFARARVPARDLLTWCDPCHRKATTVQRKAQAVETEPPAGLFEFGAEISGAGVNAL